MAATTSTEIADRLHSAAIHLLRTAAREDEASGLSPSRLSALSVIVLAGPLSLHELAAAERVRAPTMTRTVQALELDGLVARSADARDGRVVRVRATAKGRRVLHAARLRRVRRLAERLTALGSEELALLDRAAHLIEQAARSTDATSVGG